MTSIYPSGSIFECARCHIAIVRYGETFYEWNTGALHTCDTTLTRWVDILMADALDGDQASAALVPSAVDAWLAERSA